MINVKENDVCYESIHKNKGIQNKSWGYKINQK